MTKNKSFRNSLIMQQTNCYMVTIHSISNAVKLLGELGEVCNTPISVTLKDSIFSFHNQVYLYGSKIKYAKPGFG